MENWCGCRVIFYAGRNTQKILAELFNALAQGKEIADGFPAPPFVQTDGLRYRNIRWNFEESVLYCDAWQSPNLDELMELADFYGCAFECTYRLADSTMYARALYNNGLLLHDRPQETNDSQ